MAEIDHYMTKLQEYKKEAEQSNNEKDQLIFNTMIVYKGLTELLLQKIDLLESKIEKLESEKMK